MLSEIEKDFGHIIIGEIDNKYLDEFKDFFETYFSESM